MTGDIAMLAFTWPAWAWSVGGVLFLAASVLLVLTVLIQKPQGGGLAGAFGAGASSGQTAFGTKTGDALTVFTIIMFAVFITLATVMNFASQSLVGGAPAAETPKEEAPGPSTGQTPGQTPASGGQPGAGTPAAPSQPAQTQPDQTKPDQTKPVETKPAEPAPVGVPPAAAPAPSPTPATAPKH